MSIDIISIGEPLAEFNATRGDGGYQFGFGGDTSNAAIAAARQGASVGYVTAVGEDEAGRAFRALWAREGVDASCVRTDPDAATGIYFVTHGEAGHVFSYLRSHSAASRLRPRDIPTALIGDAKALHVSGISQAISDSACDAVFAAIEAARAAGVLVSYDSNLRLKLWPLARARAIIHAAMAQCDIARPGLDDARELTGLGDPDAIADFYLRLGARIVALTLGREGALVATAQERRRLPSITVDPVDATGAGDCFDGAFLAEYLRTQDPFAAGRYAAVAAALSTRGFGAVAPIPKRAEVEATLREDERRLTGTEARSHDE
ncbi:2-keto-3-deoxygluconate kinase [Rhizobiales bacterium GAS191]|nr:2-keto-3-deoxygluconate kinase [Rhizobiales bacterium GAS113]SED54231.1 2-keto-3-deoxygluconate kinase [Rhizobiales bacterium GAS191]